MADSKKSTVKRLKQAEVESLTATISTFEELKQGLSTFVCDVEKIRNSVLQVLRMLIERGIAKELIAEEIVNLQNMSLKDSETWPVKTFLVVETSLGEVIRLASRAEEEDRAGKLLQLKSQAAQIRQTYGPLSGSLKSETRKLTELTDETGALREHLAYMTSLNPAKRILVTAFSRGRELPNSISELEKLISERELEIEARQRHLIRIESEVNGLRARRDEINKIIWSLSNEVVLSKTLSDLLPVMRGMLEALPAKLKKSTLPLSGQIDEIIQKAQIRIADLQDSKTDTEFEKKIQRAQAREEKRRQAANAEREKRERTEARSNAAKLRYAEKFVADNAQIEKHLVRAEKTVARTEQRLQTLQSQLKVKTSQVELTKENLWLRFEGKMVKTVRGVEVIRDRGFFEKNPVLYPSLAGHLQKVNALQQQLKDLQKKHFELCEEFESLRKRKIKKLEMEALINRGLPTRTSKSGRPKRVVTEWLHAEELARDFLVFLGFHDARLTKQGADGGVDVTSKGAVAQVKMHSKSTPSYDIQKLVGISSVEKKVPVFFAMSYSREAISWSNRYGIALFRFERSGEVTAVTEQARTLELRSN